MNIFICLHVCFVLPKPLAYTMIGLNIYENTILINWQQQYKFKDFGSPKTIVDWEYWDCKDMCYKAECYNTAKSNTAAKCKTSAAKCKNYNLPYIHNKETHSIEINIALSLFSFQNIFFRYQ